MSRHTAGINVLLADGSVHFGLPELARALRHAPLGIGAVALGPQVPVLQATLTALRRHGVPVGLPRQQAFGGAYSALLLLPQEPGGGTSAPSATGIGFIGVPGGPVKFPSSLLLPAVQKMREAAARMQMKFPMRLVMVQDTAVSSVPQEQFALNFERILF